MTRREGDNEKETTSPRSVRKWKQDRPEKKKMKKGRGTLGETGRRLITSNVSTPYKNELLLLCQEPNKWQNLHEHKLKTVHCILRTRQVTELAFCAVLAFTLVHEGARLTKTNVVVQGAQRRARLRAKEEALLWGQIGL